MYFNNELTVGLKLEIISLFRRESDSFVSYVPFVDRIKSL